MTEELTQGSPEWLAARAGSLGASQVHEALARTKTGWGASRANIMAQLIAERLTGAPTEGFVSTAMQWGTDTEPSARAAFAFEHDVEVVQCGLFRHPHIEGTHASPDGLIGDDGMLELKCPNTATHLEYLLNGSIPAKYVTQMQWQMACAGRAYCMFASFDPRLPEEMQLFTKRFDRDPEFIEKREEDVREFLNELSMKVDALNAIYRRAA